MLITTPLPNRIGGGIGGPDRQLASATVYYAYTAAQAPSAIATITLERWEHGGSSADDDFGDNSPGDDRQVVSGTVTNCTLVTPPEFDVPPSPTLGEGVVFITPSPLHPSPNSWDGFILHTPSPTAAPASARHTRTAGRPAQAGCAAPAAGAAPCGSRAQVAGRRETIAGSFRRSAAPVARRL